MTTRLHYIQHVPFENPGIILTWAQAKDLEFSHSFLFHSEPFPAIEDFDVLIIMGGPMDVHDEDRYPGLVQEKRFIDKSIRAGKKVIGICLGAQILAQILGARVFPNAHKEIGWLPITWSPEAHSSSLLKNIHLPQTVFHWHGSTFDLPEGAMHWAFSEACHNQAFLYGENVLAFQFHLEVKPENVLAMVEHCGDELVNAPYIQSAETIKAQLEICDGINASIHQMLDNFVLG